MKDRDNAVILGEWAHIAIAKHANKILKYETKVLQDKDPENLHQMRVSMRRLRSAIAGFAVALDLPPSVSQKNIAKISRSLGTLRDLDVLLAALNRDYRPLLPKRERKKLDKAIHSLRKQRKKAVKQVKKTFNSKTYYNFQAGLQDWLTQPQHNAIGELSVCPILPNLLLPQISVFFLHPGWLVGTETIAGRIIIPERQSKARVAEILDDKELILHDLRKLAKKNRYNLELFAHFYEDTYGYYLKQIERVQEVLGTIQDCYVLKQILEKIFQSSLDKKLPELANILKTTRYQKWQEWVILQEEFLDIASQQEFRQILQGIIPSY